MPNLAEQYAAYERYWPPFLTEGAEWHPTDGPRGHRERIKRYRSNEKIYRGDHSDLMQEAWDRLLRSRGFTYDEIKALQVTIPLCTQVSDFPADMLFSEPPLLQVSGLEGDQLDAARKWLEDLERENDLQQVDYQAAISQSYRGDALIKVRHTGSDGRPVIEIQSAEYWFPHTNPDNVKELWAHVLAWTRELTVTPEQEGAPWWVRLLSFLGLTPDTRNVTVLRVEVHLRGLVVNRMYLMQGGRLKRSLPLELLPEYSPETHMEYDETSVEDFLVRHLPNFLLDNQFEGIDDYSKLKDLQKEINIRATQTGRVLDKNQAPIMYGPKMAEQFNQESGRYEAPAGFDKGYIGIDDTESVTPGAVTWDGHETAAKEHLEQMTDYFWIAAGLNRSPWSGDKAGGDEAASAIQRRMMRALATVARKRIPFNRQIPEAIYLAMQLDKDRRPGVVTWEPFRPGLHWQDGLPVDEDALVKRLAEAVDKRIMSQETAIRIMHPSWTDEMVQDEIAKIDAGQKSLLESLSPSTGVSIDLNGPDGPAIAKRARELQQASPDLTEQQAIDQATREIRSGGDR